MVKLLDKQQTVLITQFQVDDSGIDILPLLMISLADRRLEAVCTFL